MYDWIEMKKPEPLTACISNGGFRADYEAFCPAILWVRFDRKEPRIPSLLIHTER